MNYTLYILFVVVKILFFTSFGYVVIAWIAEGFNKYIIKDNRKLF